MGPGGPVESGSRPPAPDARRHARKHAPPAQKRSGHRGGVHRNLLGDKKLVIAFLFPRIDAISADDRGCIFEGSAGPQRIKCRFTLKDMLYHGKMAL